MLTVYANYFHYKWNSYMQISFGQSFQFDSETVQLLPMSQGGPLLMALFFKMMQTVFKTHVCLIIFQNTDDKKVLLLEKVHKSSIVFRYGNCFTRDRVHFKIRIFMCIIFILTLDRIIYTWENIFFRLKRTKKIFNLL